jgi:hypothetical protein
MSVSCDISLALSADDVAWAWLLKAAVIGNNVQDNEIGVRIIKT